VAKRQLGIEEIASEVGRLFGTTEKHARKWLEQRNALLDALGSVRDQATKLMSQIGPVPDGKDIPWPFKGQRGRKAKPGVPVVQPGMRESRKKRVMSAATRAKMRAAAKKRWAEIRKGRKSK
jgi:hypothetical protein